MFKDNEKDALNINKSIISNSSAHRQDGKAVAELHTKYFSIIKNHIASNIGSATDAEDLAQDVFVEFYKGNGCFRENGNPEKYLFGIAKNMIRGYYRKRERSVRTIPIEEIGIPTAIGDTRQQPDPVSLVERQELIKIIEETLAKLPPKEREALRLRFIDGLSTEQAAEKAECSINTFYQRLHLGIKALIKFKLENRLLRTEIREADQ
jgi:RNA polymerase sigma-70 factor (ECF subfamily)